MADAALDLAEELNTLLEAERAGARMIPKNGKAVAYVPLFSCAGDEYEAALRDLLAGRLRDADGLILDFRDGYGGCDPGFLTLFSPAPPVLTMIARDGRRERFDRQWRKPVAGGGDSHLLVASSILSLSRAATFKDFVAEVKEGHAVPFVTPEYFAPLKWKLTLRVLFFISRYRQIASYQGQPVAEMLERRKVLLDPVGLASRAFLGAVSALGLAR